MLDSLDTLIAFSVIMLVVSLLITLGVQAISSLLNLRGWNLCDGLTEAFKMLPEKVRQDAAGFTKEILSRPPLSDATFLAKYVPLWRYASAVRPEEVFAMIHQLATSDHPEDAGLKTKALSILEALNVPAQNIHVAKTVGQDFSAAFGVAFTALQESINTLSADPAAQGLAGQLKNLQDKAKDYRNHVEDLVQQGTSAVSAEVQAAYKKFEFWFETGQERAQVWFSTHTALITAVLAVVFAFVLRLDAVDVFKLVSNNKALKEKLVSVASTVDAQAAKTLASDPNPLHRGLTSWRKQLDNKISSTPEITGIEVAYDASRESLEEKVRQALAGLKTPNDAKPPVLAPLSADDQQKYLAQFEKALDDTSKTTKTPDDVKMYAAELNGTGFELYPKNGRWTEAEWETHWRTHVLGMLFTAALLSLGAPFWFNTLKSLTKLKSTLATNIAADKEAKKDAGNATSKLPFTTSS